MLYRLSLAGWPKGPGLGVPDRYRFCLFLLFLGGGGLSSFDCEFMGDMFQEKKKREKRRELVLERGSNLEIKRHWERGESID